jgi:hypothetical protein
MRRTEKAPQRELANTTPSKDAPAETGIEDRSPRQFWSKEFAFKRATTPVCLAGVDVSAPKPEPRMDWAPESPVAAVKAEIKRTIGHFRLEALDSLVVTVQPDADTRLRLSIACDGEDILVAVKLECGELDVLREYWGGLQRELQQRGVILGRIESVQTNLSASHTPSDSHSHTRQRSDTFHQAEESAATTEAQFREGLQRRRTSSMSLTSAPAEAHGRARVETWV